MSHRLAFTPNTPIPIATKLWAIGSGLVVPTTTDEQVPRFDPATSLPQLVSAHHPIVLSKDASVELLALDQTVLDAVDGAGGDLLHIEASFVDPLGRRVRLTGREMAALGDDRQYFGGVVARAVRPPSPDVGGAGTPSGWVMVPLVAWGRFDVWVQDDVSDRGVLGLVYLESNAPGMAGANTLTVVLYPRVVGAGGKVHAAPLRAAEELGVAGWRLVWSGVDYVQAPLMSVRAERGDTLATIAQEMSVDAEAVARANRDVPGPETPLAGELVRVPFFVRAATAVARRARATALTWKEIIRGWTTLN